MIIITIQPSDDIQNYLNIVEQNGGGILNLNPVATFTYEDDIEVPNNCTINGNGATIDFNNTAHGVKIIGTALAPKTNCSLENVTIINSTTIGVECEYTDNPILNLFNNVLVNDCATGISLTNSVSPQLIGTFNDNGVNGLMTYCSAFSINFTEFSNSTSGDGLVLDGCTSGTIFNSGFEANTSDGITMTNCEYITIVSNSIFNNGADGLKLISGNTAIIVNNNDISDNTANGINVVNNTSASTLISSNTIISNGTAVADSGTGTLVRSNQGVVDN